MFSRNISTENSWENNRSTVYLEQTAICGRVENLTSDFNEDAVGQNSPALRCTVKLEYFSAHA